MKFLTSLIIKFVMVTAVLWIMLGVFGVSFGNIMLTSILLTVISLVGDMFVLPRSGNVAATIADFGLALVLIWLVGSFLYDQPIRLGMAAFVSAIMITVGEFVFHKYLQNRYFTHEKAIPENNFTLYRKDNLQTEFGSEYDIEKPVEEIPSDKTRQKRTQLIKALLLDLKNEERKIHTKLVCTMKTSVSCHKDLAFSC